MNVLGQAAQGAAQIERARDEVDWNFWMRRLASVLSVPVVLALMLATIVLDANPDPVKDRAVSAPMQQAAALPDAEVLAPSDPRHPSPKHAARFLIQASYGPTEESIAELAEIGYEEWIARQLREPRSDLYLDYIVRKGPKGCAPCDSQYINAVMESFWRQAVLGRDQLRQRMIFALSQIFVVSAVGMDSSPDTYAAYLDVLGKNALGNYRDLLEDVTRNPGMGLFLSSLRNEKEDPRTGRTPDENYAREVMQLFSIGLWMLNEDGTRKKDAAGQDIPTYGLSDVMGMARVMTGMSYGGGPAEELRWHGWEYTDKRSVPMQFYSAHHSNGRKAFLGATIAPRSSPDGDQDLKLALDVLFQHPNVGPFLGEQLIKRFVTSNPSRAYVARVARTFADNGAGVRGDLGAVIRQILLDPEARDPAQIAMPEWGKLKEPVIRYANLLRAFHVKAQSDTYQIWNTEYDLGGLAQNPLRAPSVFNWYRPDFRPAGLLGERQLTAPEFQITSETTLISYMNFIQSEAHRFGQGPSHFGRHSLEADYSKERALLGNPRELVERLNLLLLAGQMNPQTRQQLERWSASLPGSPLDDEKKLNAKVAAVISAVMSLPEYIVQK